MYMKYGTLNKFFRDKGFWGFVLFGDEVQVVNITIVYFRRGLTRLTRFARLRASW